VAVCQALETKGQAAIGSIVLFDLHGAEGESMNTQGVVKRGGRSANGDDEGATDIRRCRCRYVTINRGRVTSRREETRGSRRRFEHRN